jgi:hypothetical protein
MMARIFEYRYVGNPTKQPDRIIDDEDRIDVPTIGGFVNLFGIQWQVENITAVNTERDGAKTTTYMVDLARPTLK